MKKKELKSAYEREYRAWMLVSHAKTWFTKESPVGLETLVDGMLSAEGEQEPEFTPECRRARMRSLLERFVGEQDAAGYVQRGIVAHTLRTFFEMYRRLSL
jgi:hypothetical protein